MSVFKRPGQQTYSYDFRYRGNRFSGSTERTTRRDAERFEEEVRRAARAASADRDKPMSFGVASTLWWEEKGQHLANSSDAERSIAWLQQQIGRSTMIADISDATVAAAVARRRGEYVSSQRISGRKYKHPAQRRLVSPATVNRSVVEPLRAILRRARRTWKQRVQDIEWKDHFLKESQERIREAAPEEEGRLRAAMRDDYEPALRFAMLTGCRRAEIVGLEWSRVDFFNDEFTVIGKGDRSRVIPMTAETRSLLWSLKDHHATSVFTYLCRRPRKAQRKGTRYPITMEGFKTEWRRTLGRASVKDFRFHDSRHTAATRLVRATGNLKLAQQLLGHSEIATTARYAHVTKEDLRAGLAASNATEIATAPAGALDKPLKKRK